MTMNNINKKSINANKKPSFYSQSSSIESNITHPLDTSILKSNESNLDLVKENDSLNIINYKKPNKKLSSTKIIEAISDIDIAWMAGLHYSKEKRRRFFWFG